MKIGFNLQTSKIKNKKKKLLADQWGNATCRLLFSYLLQLNNPARAKIRRPNFFWIFRVFDPSDLWSSTTYGWKALITRITTTPISWDEMQQSDANRYLKAKLDRGYK